MMMMTMMTPSSSLSSTCQQRNPLGFKIFVLFAILVVEVIFFGHKYLNVQSSSSSSSLSSWSSLVASIQETDAEYSLSLPHPKESKNFITGNTTKPVTTTTTTTTTTTSCGDGFVFLQDRDVVPFNTKHNNNNNNHNNNNNKIPNVLYQTGPSRCVPRDMYDDSISKWNRLGFGYRFYDDNAMDALLYNNKDNNNNVDKDNNNNNNHKEDVYKEFPLLPLALKCIEHVKMPVMKADLWRYLVIWQNGGIFADLDAVPLEGFVVVGENDDDNDANNNNNHTKTTTNTTTATATIITISPDFDAVFVPVRTAKSNVVSQWFFGAAPRHPIFHYALQTGINLLLQSNMALPISTTGPNALYYATGTFLGGTGGAWRQVPPGVYMEGQNDLSNTTTTTIINNNNNKNYNNNTRRSFVVLPRNVASNRASKSKSESYKAMNMTHYFKKQKGFKFGNDEKGKQKTCLEWAGAELVVVEGKNGEEKEEFVLYEGVKYSLKVRKV